MIVTIHQHDASMGGGIYETARYVLNPHSREARALAASDPALKAALGDRVGWVMTFGLDELAATPRRSIASAIAGRMNDVIARSNELKRAAWEANPANAGKPFRSGRPPTGPQHEHGSMSWPAGAQPTEAAMKAAFMELCRVRGIDPNREQMVVVCHTDTDHAHLHWLRNRVSHIDGHRHTPGKRDWWKVQEWSAAYDKKRGLTIPGRDESIAARKEYRNKKAREKAAAAHDLEPADKTAAPAPSPRAPKQVKRSYALKYIESAAKRSGVALDREAVLRADVLSVLHARQWSNLAKDRGALEKQMKAEKAASFDQSKRDQKAAYRQAEKELTRGFKGWLFKAIADRADRIDKTRTSRLQRERMRGFYLAERRGKHAAASFAYREAARRGIAADKKELRRNPVLRREMLDAVNAQEWQKHRDRKQERRQPIRDRAAQIIEGAKAAHKTRCAAIEEQAFDRIKAAKAALSAEQKQDAAAIIEGARARMEKPQQRLFTAFRDLAGKGFRETQETFAARAADMAAAPTAEKSAAEIIKAADEGIDLLRYKLTEDDLNKVLPNGMVLAEAIANLHAKAEARRNQLNMKGAGRQRSGRGDDDRDR